MRNIIQYPVNDRDRLDVLRRLYDNINFSEMAPGDMTGVVLNDLIESLEKSIENAKSGLDESQETK